MSILPWNGHPCDDPKREAELKSFAPLADLDDIAAARDAQAKLENTPTDPKWSGWPGQSPF